MMPVEPGPDPQDWIRRASTAELEAKYPGLREKIAQGLADAEAGRLTDGEEFFAELEREFGPTEPNE
jgi:predicted transcriptional regulator